VDDKVALCSIVRRFTPEPAAFGQKPQMRLLLSLNRLFSLLPSNGRLRAYLDILVVGSGARIVGLGSQFVVLILLSRFLSKESFGNLMTAFGFYRLAGAALGVGGSLVLLFHVSRRHDDHRAEIRLHRFSALLGAIPSGVIALAAMFAAGPIAAALDKPALAIWLQQLAPFLIFTTLLTIATGALEGRSRIGESIFCGDVVPNAVRIALLPLVAVLHMPEIYVAHVLTLSVLLPWLWLARRMWNPEVPGWQPWSTWDYSYCGKFVAATLFANQLGAADIVIASMLFSSETVADYAVATRLAALFTFFQLALLKRFAPRAGRLLELKDGVALHREFDICRRLVIGCVALTITGVLLLAPWLLPLLGNYSAAQPLLFWLAIPSFIAAFYATSDRLLIIAGQANVALVVTASSFLVLTTSPFATASSIGVIAIPVAMIVSVLLFNPIVAWRARQLTGVLTIGLFDAAMMACGSVALTGAALAGSYASAVVTCGLFGVIGGYYLTTATSRSVGEDYDRSLTPAAGGSPVTAARLVTDKASK
jgi:O-antigen/teichoic acid export membrane protein